MKKALSYFPLFISISNAAPSFQKPPYDAYPIKYIFPKPSCSETKSNILFALFNPLVACEASIENVKSGYLAVIKADKNAICLISLGELNLLLFFRIPYEQLPNHD